MAMTVLPFEAAAAPTAHLSKRPDPSPKARPPHGSWLQQPKTARVKYRTLLYIREDQEVVQSFNLIARRSLRPSATGLDSEWSRSVMADAVRHSTRCSKNMNTVAKKIAAR